MTLIRKDALQNENKQNDICRMTFNDSRIILFSMIVIIMTFNRILIDRMIVNGMTQQQNDIHQNDSQQSDTPQNDNYQNDTQWDALSRMTPIRMIT